ncbi:MAG TPA: phosphoenolpyruvate--protein phosphotransferase [Gammaproteobacteria bacterium]|nr:phosphoenolpyruvate--protein phosphotransferase [Gammaproteobacteria bacterium]
MLGKLQHIVQQVNEAASLDEALAIIVSRVKEAMGADVCFVFLKDATTGHYVLTASDGLYPESVGKVRLAPNEGLVGLVATRQELINLENAADHPSFRYFPETGEERYHSFLGVPLVHFRQALGVLAVQRREQRLFDADEVAFLVTIGAQLAGSLSYAATGSTIPPAPAEQGPAVSFIQGLPGAPGVAFGTIVLPSPFAGLESVADREPQDLALEETAFRQAVSAVQAELRDGAERMTDQLPSEAHAIFDAYILMLDGTSLVEETVARIRAGNWAPGALRDTIAEHARAFEQMEDPYLRARAEDIRTIGRRLLLRLQAEVHELRDYPEGTVLLAEEVGLGAVAEVPAGRLAGIVCLRGSGHSHIAIVAQALAIPAVMGLGHRPTGPLEGHSIIVDGYQGRVFIDPQPAVIEEYQRLVREEAALSERLQHLRDLPAETPDGVHIQIHVNIGLLSEISIVNESGMDGVGLYRTEFPFMLRSAFPLEEEQYGVYRKMLESFAPKPVIMRALDVGGDKPLPYYPMEEENPFLGWRGIRFTLHHPEIFLTQLRAMLRANAGLNNLQLIFPMISQVEEVKEAKELLARAFNELRAEGQDAVLPPVGAMVEVPSAVYKIETLARYVDFFSIGTNDLTQYVLAVDRNNPQVASLYDALDPAVLRALCMVVRRARRFDKPVSVCGEIAGDPAAAILFLGMGAGALSVNASNVPRIKWVIRTIPQSYAKHVLRQALQLENAKAIRQMLNCELEQTGLGELIRAGK